MKRTPSLGTLQALAFSALAATPALADEPGLQPGVRQFEDGRVAVQVASDPQFEDSYSLAFLGGRGLAQVEHDPYNPAGHTVDSAQFQGVNQVQAELLIQVESFETALATALADIKSSDFPGTITIKRRSTSPDGETTCLQELHRPFGSQNVTITVTSIDAAGSMSIDQQTVLAYRDTDLSTSCPVVKAKTPLHR